MKVTLFSPVHRRSLIAHATGAIVEAFRDRGDEVAVVASESSAPATGDRHPSLVGAVDWHDLGVVTGLTDRADVIVYQLDDSYSDFAGALFWLSRVGGCLLLNDVRFGDLIGGWVVTDPDALGDFFRNAGLTGRSGGLGRRDVGDGAVDRWLLPYADGVVSHSSFVTRALGDGAPVPLAAAERPVPEVVGATDATPRSGDGRLRLVTVSASGPIGAVDTVIHAIAFDPELRARVEYRVAGVLSSELRGYLEGLAADLGVRLTTTAGSDGVQFAQEYRDADAVIAPRDRAEVSAPAAVVGAMRAGKAVIISDEGFSADLPGDAIITYPRRDAVRGVGHVLRAIIGGEIDLDTVGERAARVAATRFRVEDYVGRIAELAPAAAQYGAVRGLDQAFAPLRTWQGLEPHEVFQRYLDDTAIFRP